MPSVNDLHQAVAAVTEAHKGASEALTAEGARIHAELEQRRETAGETPVTSQTEEWVREQRQAVDTGA